jgi:steroid delta-isomerase-like uncharacterized protein
MANIVDVMQEYTRAWNSHDAEKVASFFPEDCLYDDHPAGFVFKDRAAVKAYAEGVFKAFPDMKIEVKSFIVSGNMSASEAVMSGTATGPLPSGAPPTGKSFSVEFSGIAEHEGDLIKRITTYYDSATLYRQLGVLPAPPDDYKATFRRAIEEE